MGNNDKKVKIITEPKVFLLCWRANVGPCTQGQRLPLKLHLQFSFNFGLFCEYGSFGLEGHV